MKIPMKKLVACAALAAVMGAATLAVADDLDLTWYSLDGGGVTLSTGWEYELGGTIGQADPAVLTGGDYVLTGGFWPVTLNSDQDTCGVAGNLAWYDGLATCLLGPDALLSLPGCWCYDLDDDGDTDLFDYHLFQQMFTGS
jgi:hypothetical protein